MPIRISELAKELNMSSRTLTHFCETRFGIHGKSHSSKLTDDIADAIRRKLQKSTPSSIRINQLAKELGISHKGLARICATQLGLRGKSHSSNLTDEVADKLRLLMRTGGARFLAQIHPDPSRSEFLAQHETPPTGVAIHFFEEKVWAPLRRSRKEKEQAEAWARLESCLPATLERFGLATLPPEVVFPGEAWATLFLRDVVEQYARPYESPEDRQQDKDHLQDELRHMRQNMAFANFFEAYGDSKAIYKLNRPLVEALASIRPPDDYPTEALTLPRRAVVVDLSETMRKNGEVRGDIAIGISYDLATGREREGGLMLRFVGFHVFPGMGMVPLPLADLDLEPGKTLRESLKNVGVRFAERLNDIASEAVEIANQDELREYLPELQEALKDYSHLVEESRLSEAEMEAEYGHAALKEHEETRRMLDHFALAVNALLYIQGEEDVVRLIHPGAKPPKTSQNPEKARRFRDLAPAEIFEVGQRFAATIERWEQEAPEDAEPSSEGKPGRSVRPHVRSAHPHIYRTGPGRKDVRVRFLAPIPVKGGRQDAEQPLRLAPVR